MSRIGRKPVPLPAKVTVTLSDGAVTAKGPKGELTLPLPPDMTIKQEEGVLVVERPTDERHHRALHGLTRALLSNLITGVSTGFERKLTVEGVGYSGEVKNKNLVMKLGYSHEIVVQPPDANTTFEVEKVNPTTTTIRVKGIDKQVVGQVAANIRELRPPEPYLGKGIRYSDEVIRRKEGKTAK